MLIHQPLQFIREIGSGYTKKLEKLLIKNCAALKGKSPWKFYVRFKLGHEMFTYFSVGLCVGNAHMDMDYKNGSRVVRGGSYQRYERKGRRYSVEEILPLLGGKTGKKTRIITLDGDDIKVSSTRLLTFKRHGVECSVCGMRGLFFVKERHRKSNVKKFHLNLYGQNEHGSEILMTSDHIIPRSKGGSEGVLNRQPMCIHCNNKKANFYNKEDEQKGAYKYGVS